MLLGRTRELDELSASEDAPLVTLWGPSGVGKTTLARAHVRGKAVVWVDLAPVRTRAGAASAIARALGVVLEPSEDEADAIARAARRTRIVADNAEQLDAGARALLHALSRAEGVRLLVTSQDALAVPHEHAIEVRPLAMEDALALFAARAGTVDDEAAREIVRRLDAIPLAIELAAARVPLLGIEGLRARLDEKLDVLRAPERGPRHETLRAAIAWSWELLDEPDRDALLACATFEAPFDVSLAERVMGVPDALDRLERLRRRALLHADAGELRLLEPVRDFARSQPRFAEMLERHARAVAEACLPLAEDLLRGKAVPPALAKRHADLEAAASRGSAPAAFALVAHLSVTGPADAIVARVDAALETSDRVLSARLRTAAADALRAVGDADGAITRLDFETEDRRTRADRDRVLGSVLRAKGAHADALAAKLRALETYRDLGEEALAGICLGEIAAIHQSEGKLALARTKHAEAIAVHVAESSRRAEGVERSYLAVATHRAGDPASAIRLHEEALAIHREVGHLRLEGAELLHLAFVFHEIGEPARARNHFASARETLARAGARGLESLAIALAARLEVDEGDHVRAELLLAESAHVAPRGFPRLVATRKVVEGHLAMSKGETARAAQAYEEALATSRDVEVGFEALTPSYLALARKESAAPALPPLENPHLRAAHGVLAAALRGEPFTPDEAALRHSSEVRRALAFVGARPALRVGAEARTVILPDGRRLDLARRKNVRLVLLALADARRRLPGEPLGPEALVAAGWPGERMRGDAAQKRLHTAIWTLRSMGLEGLLVTREDGYFLDPAVPIELAREL